MHSHHAADFVVSSVALAHEGVNLIDEDDCGLQLPCEGEEGRYQFI